MINENKIIYDFYTLFCHIYLYFDLIELEGSGLCLWREEDYVWEEFRLRGFLNIVLFDDPIKI